MLLTHPHSRAVLSIASIFFIASETPFSPIFLNAPISWFSSQYVCAITFFVLSLLLERRDCTLSCVNLYGALTVSVTNGLDF